ncbi:MAG: AMP-dependent synthetase, partial [Nitrosopumilaceae archaeon]|nr:AMP-dependent synthetase [Nitrosopumilaceae archaeon]
MSKFVFEPSKDQILNSNLHAFMKKFSINSINDLTNKAKNDLGWYWQEVDKDIGIVWDENYSKVHDSSKGIQ